jgi:hypothetical protein
LRNTIGVVGAPRRSQPHGEILPFVTARQLHFTTGQREQRPVDAPFIRLQPPVGRREEDLVGKDSADRRARAPQAIGIERGGRIAAGQRSRQRAIVQPEVGAGEIVRLAIAEQCLDFPVVRQLCLDAGRDLPVFGIAERIVGRQVVAKL